MVKLIDVYKKLDKSNNIDKLEIKNQSTNDIINQVLDQHIQNSKEAKKIAYLFDGGNLYETSKNIWNFLKYQIPYKVEPSDKQTTKTLSRMLFDAIHGKGNDCKHYAGFTGAILDALGYKNWRYRFAGYSKFINVPTHVYCYGKDDNGIIYIDAVINGFDLEKPYVLNIDKKINSNMSLYKLSGFEEEAEIGNIFQKFQRKVNEGAKNLSTFATDKAKQAANFAKEEGKKIASQLLDGTKTLGLSVPRNAFLLLILANVKGWATGLKNKTMDDLIWWSRDFGGDRVKLVEAIQKGAKNKRLLGFDYDDIIYPSMVGAIGEPVSIASAMTTATPILLKVTAFLAAAEKVADKAEGILDKGKKIVNTGKDTVNTIADAKKDFEKTTGINVTDIIFKKEEGITGNKNSISSSDLKNTTPEDAKRVAEAIVDKATGKSKIDTKTLLLIGGAGLALLLILKKK